MAKRFYINTAATLVVDYLRSENSFCAMKWQTYRAVTETSFCFSYEIYFRLNSRKSYSYNELHLKENSCSRYM